MKLLTNQCWKYSVIIKICHPSKNSITHTHKNVGIFFLHTCMLWIVNPYYVIHDVILALISRALPLIDILALDQSGGAGLGHESGLDDIIQPL